MDPATRVIIEAVEPLLIITIDLSMTIAITGLEFQPLNREIAQLHLIAQAQRPRDINRNGVVSTLFV